MRRISGGIRVRYLRRETGGERATLAPPVSASPVGKLRRRDAKA